MRTLLKTKQWHIYFVKSSSTSCGNGWESWSIVFRKVIGNGDDGVRGLN